MLVSILVFKKVIWCLIRRMPVKFHPWFFLILIGLFGVGCRSTVESDYPIIYNAWNARYQYNPTTREMLPVVDEQSIGRAWSRDEFGRLNSMYFFSGVNGRDEDLLHTHKVKLDKKRNRQWEVERESRISQVRELIAVRESNQSSEIDPSAIVVEEAAEDEFDVFTPVSNIDSTIPEMEPGPSIEVPSDDGVPELSPFAPLPELP
jgi:hypothetical protein